MEFGCRSMAPSWSISTISFVDVNLTQIGNFLISNKPTSVIMKRHRTITPNLSTSYRIVTSLFLSLFTYPQSQPQLTTSLESLHTRKFYSQFRKEHLKYSKTFYIRLRMVSLLQSNETVVGKEDSTTPEEETKTIQGPTTRLISLHLIFLLPSLE